MQSRTLLNIALFLVVVVLAAYIYTSSKQEQASSESAGLTRLPADDVSRIYIQHNQRKIELNKEDGVWRMLRPINIEANSFRIDTLLKILEAVSHATYPAKGLDLTRFGLHEAGTSISFNDLRIEFGVVNPINNYRDVRTGETVHLIDDHYYPLISSQVGTLVARELIASGAVMEKLVLPEHTLYRDENNIWHSSSEIDPDAINEVIYHWQNSQAFGVHNFMPREPLAEISVFLVGKTEPVRFHVTDNEPWLIIARPDLNLEYHFNLEFYDRLLNPGAITELAEELSE